MSDVVERQIILGAGASDGFPAGSQLLKDIKAIGDCVKCSLENPNSPYDYGLGYKVKVSFIKKELENLGNEDFLKNVAELAHNLKVSCATSIDFYTSRIADPKKQKVAEALIGAIISSYQLQKEKTWYGYLLPLFFPANISELSPDKKKEEIEKEVKKIRIVTFNYDLSLEKFLYEFLKNNVFFKDGEEGFLEEAKKTIFGRIKHVYGSIDDPISCNMDEIEKENYQTGFARILIDACKHQEKYSQNIKLIDGKRSNEKIELIECNYLYVFGFGFDPLNIEKIGLGSGMWKKNCFITNFDDNQRIKRIALNTLYKHGKTYQIPVISKLSVKKALEEDFSLSENTGAERIPSNQRFGNISPYFGIMKYENSQKTKPV